MPSRASSIACSIVSLCCCSCWRTISWTSGGTGAVEHLERALADLGEVGQRLAAVEQGEVAADGARRLEGVVHRRQLRVQQRLAAVAVDEPEVLVGRDVAEVPDQGAHQRGVRGLDVGVGQRGDEVERALARLFEGAGGERGDGHGTRVPRTLVRRYARRAFRHTPMTSRTVAVR